MQRSLFAVAPFVAALLAAGCEDDAKIDTADTDVPADTDTDTVPDTDDTDPGDTDTDPGDTDTDTPPIEDGWAYGGTPCDSRTDDLWFDDVNNGFLGCGQATTGEGFWTTTDGGLSWAPVTTNPAAFFESFRVNDIYRDPTTGMLFAAGTGSGLGVVGLDATHSLVEVWTPGGTIDDSFTAGTFRVDSTGFAVVESLTGHGLMTRADATVGATEWTPGGTWSTDGTSHQILDMDVHDDQFYGVGSTISESPYVFLPSAAPGFALDPREMSSGAFGWRGELWAIDVDASGIVAGGVDQESDVGHVFTFVFPGDPAIDTWNDFDLSTLYPSDATWVRGVCRSGDHVLAVGELTAKGDGFVLQSTDAGVTFTDITPTDTAIPSLWDCWVHDDGSFVVAGGAFVAKYTP